MATVITFEGIDGTGKGTQMELARDLFLSMGKKVLSLSFPRYDTFFGNEVGAYLTARDGVRADTVDGKSMALWFALDRWDTFRNISIDEYDVVVINRYVLSNAVYQSIRDIDLDKPDLIDFMIELEYEHFGIPRPDLCLLFDMDLSAANRNVSKKGFRDYIGGNGSDIYESVPDIQKRARQKYLDYAKKLDNVRIIPCMEDGRLKPIDTVFSLVKDVFAKEGLILPDA